MSQPHVPFDPDPLTAVTEAEWEELRRVIRQAHDAQIPRSPLIGLLVAALSGAIVGALAVWLVVAR